MYVQYFGTSIIYVQPIDNYNKTQNSYFITSEFHYILNTEIKKCIVEWGWGNNFILSDFSLHQSLP